MSMEGWPEGEAVGRWIHAVTAGSQTPLLLLLLMPLTGGKTSGLCLLRGQTKYTRTP